MGRLQLFFFSLLLSITLFTKPASDPEEGYTINFENVALKEVLQFLSKIGNINLIYNESDVAFNISFISDKPTSLIDVKSALVQILRINGLQLIEDGSNLIIHKNPMIKQIPTVVSKENPIKGQTPAIITRVFKIHRGNPTSIAAIITPLLSATSLVEVSLDTRQLIVTDVASSITTVAQLLKSLDVPETPYDVDTYEAENMNVLELQLFAQKIMAPLTENTTLEIIAQPETNTIYIVSTPFLIDKTISLLEEIDKDITSSPIGNGKIASTNILIYTLKHKGKDVIIKTLDRIIKESDKQGFSAEPLAKILKSVQYIRATHSLIFIGLPENLSLLTGLLENIDTKGAFLGSENASFFLYEPQGMNIDEFLKVIDEIAENLEVSGYPNESLLHVLTHGKPIYDLNSILFISPPDTKAELDTLLSSILSSYSVDLTKSGINNFYLYNIKLGKEEQINAALEKLIKYLKNNDYPNENLIKTISSKQWIKATNSLFFVGNAKSLKELSEILPTLDVSPSVSQEMLTQSPPSTEFLVFTPKNSNAEHLKTLVCETSAELKNSELSDPAFMCCLNSVRVLKSSDQLIFTGTPAALNRLVILLDKLDMQSHGALDENSIFLYHPSNLSYEDLKEVLLDIVADSNKIQKSGSSPLSKTINTMKYNEKTGMIQFIGTPQTLKKLQEILAQVDGSSNVTSGIGSNVLVYKVKSVSPNELLDQLKAMAQESKRQNQKTEALFVAINSGKYVKSSNSIIFVGKREALTQIEKILADLDKPNSKLQPGEKGYVAPGDRTIEGYQIYIPQYVSGPELIQMVTSFEAHLANSGMLNEPLSETIDHLTYVQKTNTIIVSGAKDAVTEVIGLFKQFDNLETLESTGGIPSENLDTINEQGFLLYKIQNVEGPQIVSALGKISTSLKLQEKSTKKNDDLIQAIGSIQWIETTNSLIATGPSNVLSKLDQLLKSVDRPVAQVFIEVLVVDTQLSDDTTFGLSWQNKGTLQNKFGYSLGNLQPGSNSPAFPLALNLSNIDGKTTPTGSAIPPLGGGYLGVIGDIIFHKGNSYSSLGSLLNALKTEGDTTIVLSQKIMTQDNQNAKIFSGQNIPFTGSLVTTSGLSQTTNANLEYRNVGVTLSITPNISADGLITLSIDQEISQEENDGTDESTNVQSSTINGIRTSKTNMTTRIRVPDRHFLLLSGTMSNTVTRKVAGIPCLGGLPLIGAAFSTTEKSTTNHNVIMFVKPHIIHNTMEFQEITANQEKIFSSSNQANQADFEDGLELVKSPSDRDDYDYDFDYDD